MALQKYWIVVITTSQFHSTKPELRFCAGLFKSCLRRVGDLQCWQSLAMVLAGNKLNYQYKATTYVCFYFSSKRFQEKFHNISLLFKHDVTVIKYFLCLLLLTVSCLFHFTRKMEPTRTTIIYFLCCKR